MDKVEECAKEFLLDQFRVTKLEFDDQSYPDFKFNIDAVPVRCEVTRLSLKTPKLSESEVTAIRTSLQRSISSEAEKKGVDAYVVVNVIGWNGSKALVPGQARVTVVDGIGKSKGKRKKRLVQEVVICAQSMVGSGDNQERILAFWNEQQTELNDVFPDTVLAVNCIQGTMPPGAEVCFPPNSSSEDEVESIRFAIWDKTKKKNFREGDWLLLFDPDDYVQALNNMELQELVDDCEERFGRVIFFRKVIPGRFEMTQIDATEPPLAEPSGAYL
jgi:hypothetical protein